MSEELFQSMEKYILSIQKDITEKINQLEEKIDHIYLEHQSYMKEFKQKLQSQENINDKSTQKALETVSQGEEKEQQRTPIIIPSNISPVTTEFISKKFEEHTNLILHFFQTFLKGFEHSKEFASLSEEDKRYVTGSSLQTIGERLTVSLQNEELNNEVHQLKNKINLFQSNQNSMSIQLEEYKKQLSYKQQEVSALKKIIAEKDSEFEQLQQENKKITQELEDIKNQLIDLEQIKVEQNIQLEKNELYAKISFDEETKYKKELTELKDALNKRKIEIRTLKKENDELHEIIKLKGQSS